MQERALVHHGDQLRIHRAGGNHLLLRGALAVVVGHLRMTERGCHVGVPDEDDLAADLVYWRLSQQSPVQRVRVDH
jgi:hypothetical protein